MRWSWSHESPLVVDDDQGTLLVAKAAVEQSGHQWLTSEDGDEARKLYRSERPEAVVTDLEMPGLNGLDADRQALEGRPGGEQSRRGHTP